jgi:hypothetical protein
MNAIPAALPPAANEAPPLLPAVDDTAPRPDPTPLWKPFGIEALGSYAGALRVDRRTVPPHRIHSIPTPWGRAMLFEQALFTPDHPAAEGVLAEWRGLLGAVALADVLPMELRVVPVELPTPVRDVDNVMADLRGMAPDATRWTHLGLIYSGSSLLGATSAYTLAFTGTRAISAPVPFLSTEGRLLDPGSWYAHQQPNPDLLFLLLGWIGATRTALQDKAAALGRWMGERPASRTTQPLNRAVRILAHFDAWEAEVANALAQMRGQRLAAAPPLLPSPFAGIFPAGDAVAVYAALQPVKGGGNGENQLRYRAGDGYAPVVLDPRPNGVILGRDDAPYRGSLVLEQHFRADVRDGHIRGAFGAAQLGSPAVLVDTALQPRLIAVTAPSAAVATLSDDTGANYLLPFDRKVLDWFTPRQVVDFTRLTGDRQAGFELSFTVPLSDSLSVRWTRYYAPTEVEGTDRWATPRVALWPDFVADRWTHYFYFGMLAAAGEANLRLRPIPALLRDASPNELAGSPLSQAPTDSWKDSTDGLTWEEWSRPLAGWEGRAGLMYGLLLAQPLPEKHIREGQSWDVSIDFGSTHSRAFRRPPGTRTNASIDAVALRPRVVALLGDTTPLPMRFFLPANFSGSADGEEEVQTMVRLPFGVPVRATSDHWLPSDGILFSHSLVGLEPLKGLHARLKWHERDEDVRAFQAAISQLYLCVAAEAAAREGSISSVRVAYPSVFPKPLRDRHSIYWQQLAHRYDFRLEPAASESEALQRFTAASHGDAGVGVGLLAVDIGGSTADLAVWRDGPPAFSSVRIAGSLIGALVASDQAVADAVLAAARALLGDKFRGWGAPAPGGDAPPRGELVRLGFDDLLRTLSRKPPNYSTYNLAVELAGNPAGQKLIAHAGFLYATIAYLLGMMARREQLVLPHYDLHFAGHGSQFIRWLDVLVDDGNRIPERFFLAGLAAQGKSPTATVSGPDRPKEEVGRGLLLFAPGESPRPISRDTFVGESGFIAGRKLPWDRVVVANEVPDVVSDGIPELGKMEMLRRFVETFDTTAETRALARALGLDTSMLDRGVLHNRIIDRLHMPTSAWGAAASGDPNATERARLEPIVVVGAKALLEVVTRNMQLFDE